MSGNDLGTNGDLVKQLAAAEKRIAELEAEVAAAKALAREARLDAHRDGLTGLLNLRGLQLIVDHICRSPTLSRQDVETASFLESYIQDRCANGQDSPIEARHKSKEDTGLLFVFDLNNLKTINDTYGHDAGNSYILAFSEILKKFFRCSDFIAHARTGGDEFVAYLRNANLDQFKARLQELYREMKCIKFSYTNNETGNIIELEGSCAIGCTEVCHNSSDSFDSASIRADREMYDHKVETKRQQQGFLSRDFAGASVGLSGHNSPVLLPGAQSEGPNPPVWGIQPITYG